MDVYPLLPDAPVTPQTGWHGRFLTNTHDPDSRYADATHLALREARVNLWRDLWAKTEQVDQLVAERTHALQLENRRLRRTVRDMRRAHR